MQGSNGSLIGKKVSNYEIIKKIGEGAKGVIYKAKDLKLDRFVALKFLPYNLLSNEEEKKRFLYEAKAASRLDHPNVCTIHEINESEEGQIFICMSNYEGQTLSEKIKKGMIPIDEIIDIAGQISEGMQAAHDKGIVHRDIKPHNIFLTQDGNVKILDFGLAKLTGQKGLTTEGIAVGTIGYMSPQQASGEKVDHKTDIWSLGVVMFEMITGVSPFKSDSIETMIYSIIHKDPDSLSGLRSGAPKELERIVNKCLSKNLSGRYETFGELISDLNKLIPEKILSSEFSLNKKGFRVNSKKFMKHILISSFVLLGISFLIWFTFIKVDLDLTMKNEIISNEKIQSIAVLPFIDMSKDQEYRYFSDGIVEELINALTRIEGIKVASRTSSFQFQDRGYDIKEVGKKLNVKKILEGSIRIEGKKIRIIVQLIDAKEDKHIWSKKYERDFNEIFKIQDEITNKIVEFFKVEFNEDQKKQIKKRYTKNPEAYKLYLQGRFHWNKRIPEYLRKGMKYFNKAIELDPEYALAYVGIADTYHLLASYSDMPPQKAFPEAKKAVLKALKIDKNLSEAHTSIAMIQLLYEWDFIEAEKSFKKSIELDPNYFRAYKWYSYYLIFAGRIEEAIKSAKKAIELEPFSQSCKSTLMAIFYFAEKYDHVIELYNKHFTNKFSVSSFYAAGYLGLTFVQKKMYKEAISALKQAVMLTFGEEPGALSPLGYAYAISGNRKEAEKILYKLKKLSKTRYVSSAYTAVVYIGLKNKNEAFSWLEKAYKERSEWMVYMKVEHIANSLRDDPRFISLMKKVGNN